MNNNDERDYAEEAYNRATMDEVEIETRPGTVVSYKGETLKVTEVWVNDIKAGHVYVSEKSFATFGSNLDYCLNGTWSHDEMVKRVATKFLSD